MSFGTENVQKETMINFEELSGDEAFKERVLGLETNLEDIQKLIDTMLTQDVYSKLQDEDKVRYDLFLSFAINSLYWVYLRTQGEDPNQTDLKNELQRVKEYMAKSKKLYEKKHVMPRIDKGAAGRFIRSGLFDPDDPNRKPAANEEPAGEASVAEDSQNIPTTNPGKRKREESESD